MIGKYIKLSIKIILLAGLKLLLELSWFESINPLLSIKIILLAGLKHVQALGDPEVLSPSFN